MLIWRQQLQHAQQWSPPPFPPTSIDDAPFSCLSLTCNHGSNRCPTTLHQHHAVIINRHESKLPSFGRRLQQYPSIFTANEDHRKTGLHWRRKARRETSNTHPCWIHSCRKRLRHCCLRKIDARNESMITFSPYDPPRDAIIPDVMHSRSSSTAHTQKGSVKFIATDTDEKL